MKYDVCIPTLKKEKEFKDCLDAIKKIIPYNQILIDDSPEGRGTSRNKLMKKVRTEFFFFIDDDIVINQKWFNQITKKIQLDNKLGADNGLGLSDSFILNVLRHILMLRTTLKQRGFTSNTLIRTKSVKGIKLDDNNRFEDFQLQNKIKEKGWKWKTIRAYCFHTKPGKEVWKDAKRDFQELVKKEGLIKGFLKI